MLLSRVQVTRVAVFASSAMTIRCGPRAARADVFDSNVLTMSPSHHLTTHAALTAGFPFRRV